MEATIIECEAAVSDAVLQAARAAIPPNSNRWLQAALPFNGKRNKPLIPLLVALLDATQATAAAVADNALDDTTPIDRQLANELKQQALLIAAHLESASDAS